MRPAGEVVRVAQGLLVLRAPDRDRPEVGSEVVDDQLAVVGRVVDVFGPVARPYAAVAPEDDVGAATLVGARLYEREES